MIVKADAATGLDGLLTLLATRRNGSAAPTKSRLRRVDGQCMVVGSLWSFTNFSYADVFGILHILL